MMHGPRMYAVKKRLSEVRGTLGSRKLNAASSSPRLFYHTTQKLPSSSINTFGTCSLEKSISLPAPAPLPLLVPGNCKIATVLPLFTANPRPQPPSPTNNHALSLIQAGRLIEAPSLLSHGASDLKIACRVVDCHTISRGSWVDSKHLR